MAWLGEELSEKEQDGRTPFSPRCLKDVVEERLFAHRRDLFTRLDLVFMDMCGRPPRCKKNLSDCSARSRVLTCVRP